MMLVSLLKSKIHRATVTDCCVDYIGSVGIDEGLMELAGILPYEHVHVWNVTNGDRLETYAIPAEKGSGVISLNGAAAHHASLGDKVIIAAFCWTDDDVAPRMILVDEHNQYVRVLESEPPLTVLED